MGKALYTLFTIVFLIQHIECTEKGESLILTNDGQVGFSPSTDLRADFLSPPDYAKPRVFWWWLEGNITEEGIRQDLIDMKNAGIKGAIVFDAGSSSYKQVSRTDAGPVFMSPEWRELFVYTCLVADSLDMEISLNITSGWNDGGEWVTPEFASKKLIWSELEIQGSKLLKQKLPMPSGVLEEKGKAYYKPIVVLALKLNEKSDRIVPLENSEIKSVHSIYAIPKIEELGYDWDIFLKEEPSPSGDFHARLSDVIDITEYVNEEGFIEWNVPDGKYLIMRFGYTGTGIKVSTHSPGGGGLAIDYMSKEAMDLQYEKVAGILLKDIASHNCGKSFKYLHDDSWELGASNWTNDFDSAFKQLNGYEIYPYLPILAGRIVDNREESNRFLYDFRKTIAHLIWERHYKRFSDLAHKSNLSIHPESGGPHPAPIDALKNLGLSEIPMGEFWIRSKTHRIKPEDRLFVKQASSAAHIYGKRFVQAEGPTSVGPHWEEDFAYMKPTLDRVYCEGLNRFVVHTFTHSPKNAGIPGNEYFAGTHFNQNVTWWEQVPAFFTWNARNSFMLSQGLFVGDVCFYYGDNVPNQVPLKHTVNGLGEGYDYDVCNTEVLLTRMTAHNGKIWLPDGMSYEVLVLPDRKGITPEVLLKIEELVLNGATIIGSKPDTFVGLRNKKDAEFVVRQKADAVWGNVDGISVYENKYGKGKVVWGKAVREVLQEKGILPDFEYKSKKKNAFIDYIHRKTGETDIYYVVNRNEQPEYLIATFRIDGRVPERWNPETGEITPLTLYTSQDSQVSIPLFLEPFGSTFIVFREKVTGDYLNALYKDGEMLFPYLPKDTFETIPFVTTSQGELVFMNPGNYVLKNKKQNLPSLSVSPAKKKEFKNLWEIQFNDKWGRSEKIEWDTLRLWNEQTIPQIKYYSGTAIYENSIMVDKDELSKKHVYLDLGKLYNIAEVWINGVNAGVWWQPPFKKDITRYLVAGENQLQIKVVNLWPNRLIGDQFLPEEGRTTKTNVIKFTKDVSLFPSGLLGPVSVLIYD